MPGLFKALLAGSITMIFAWQVAADDGGSLSLVTVQSEHFWRVHAPYAITGIFLLVVQTIGIVLLLRQRARLRDSKASLARANDRLNLAMESGNSVGWEWDLATKRDFWFGDLPTMFGIQATTFEGKLGDFYRFVHSEDRTHIAETMTRARESHKPYVTEFRVVRTDGVTRWVASRGAFEYDKNGRATRMLGLAIDVTEQKRVQDELRESEERFRLVANAAPVMIWMCGPDKLCDYVNQSWLDFTGRPREQELGNGWTDSVHPDDQKRCWSTYSDSFDRREMFEMEYRVRRRDGEYRWILDFGTPRFNADGTFAGYIGSCVDVTERKRAEEVVSNLTRKLIEAHEEERTWIARELHDDINQRLALLAINLERLQQDIPVSNVQVSRRLAEEIQQLSEITSEIQGLSHRLHSSKLEYLGLASAASSFCREHSERHSVRINFECGELERNIPDEISLCMFRVLQEALQNAAKHSGSGECDVSLDRTSTEIHLVVQDYGSGFDLETARNGRGLGLTSMKERLKLIGGSLSIESRSGVGTILRASAPVKIAEKVFQAAV